MGISGAVGTVRAQANVKVAVAAAPGSPDYAVAMGGPVRAHMSEIRACFGEAMARASAAEGRVEFELEALAQGRARVRVTSDRAGDKQMTGCMRDSLARSELVGVPKGARSLVSLDLVNPSARLRAQVAERGESVSVKPVAGGQIQSQGGTQQGEVEFRVTGPGRSRAAVEAIHRGANARLAGLLDCRRKASKGKRASHGTVTLDVKTEPGKAPRAHVRADHSLGRTAPACVTEWLGRADNTRLAAGEVELAITFGKD
jgi:hypothetical protein